MARYKVGVETRDRILAATRELLGQVGLEGTTLKAICEQAGIGAGSFYNLFDTKDEAILTIVREAIEAVDPSAGGEAETVGDLVEAYLQFVTGNPVLARIYLQIVVSGVLTDRAMKRRVVGHQRRRVQRLAQAIERERPSVATRDAEAEAQLMLATLNGLSVHWMLDASVDMVGHARSLVRVAVS